MNSLTKMQILMAGFILLVLASFLVDMLLLIPAVFMFILQLPVARRDLKREYPEDWKLYMRVFYGYEFLLMFLFYMIISTPISFTSLGALYMIFFIVLSLIVLTIALKYILSRRHCYGTVLFSTKGWVGVEIKSDLFSKINGANYAIENPLGVHVKKGDRAKISVKAGLNRAIPFELAEVVG